MGWYVLHDMMNHDDAVHDRKQNGRNGFGVCIWWQIPVVTPTLRLGDVLEVVDV
jgi:hypothetical protein